MSDDAGVSLIEVLVASLLIGLALVPLMELFPGLLEQDAEAERAMRLGTVAAGKMEEILAALRNDISSVSSGGEACSDLPNCRVEWTVTTETSSATQGVGSLEIVAVTACQDGDGSLSCDPGEAQVRYDAKTTSRP